MFDFSFLNVVLMHPLRTFMIHILMNKLVNKLVIVLQIWMYLATKDSSHT